MVSKPGRRTVLGATAGAALTGAFSAPARAASFAGTSGHVTVDSPNGRLRVTVLTASGDLRYQVVRDGRVLVASSGLGLDLGGRPSLTSGLVVESVKRRTIKESWRPVWGADALVRNHARECVVRTVQSASGIRLDLVVRAFDDGVGFRYHLPAQTGLDTYTVTATSSCTRRR
ncbi:glycoside hydrolase family 97 N-terminal domain-containing protein [Streptomyces sp. NPDC021218]|uniref:glycoside hydrolase family 97 N-terminal domain-containing protein n=1 Tax=Streptomyces sp. NPDC021218 TaxID=3365119 RepID=UPI00378E8665